MTSLNSLFSKIISVEESTFESLATEVFNYQARHNDVFNKYLRQIGHATCADSMNDIVFLPIEFYKDHVIKTGNWTEETVFESSGTTSQNTSRHFIRDLNVYQNLSVQHFENLYGPLKEYSILALLPSYLERQNSGLVAMVDTFMQRSNQRQESGYYLANTQALKKHLLANRNNGVKTILWGVTFALLDLAEDFPIDFADLIVMETGGMKGRREEMVREEVHHVLKEAFGVDRIHSEYGMTELSSQAYAKSNGCFEPSATMRVLVRDINDPFSLVSTNKAGGLNIIDLANLDTCSFIETKDIGRLLVNNQFEVLGRMDNSDIRGCNLMIG